MIEAKLVGSENKDAYRSVFVQILQAKKAWVEKNKLPNELKYPVVIVADKPADLKNAFIEAAEAVYGDDDSDGRKNVKFARDIFHECQQHNGTIGNRLDKNIYCADFAQVMSLLRGPKIGIPNEFQYQKTVEALFLQSGMKETVEALLQNKEASIDKTKFAECVTNLSKLIADYQEMSQWYLGKLLYPYQSDDHKMSVKFFTNEGQERCFDVPFLPNGIFEQLISKIFAGLEIDLTDIRSWKWPYNTKEQFKFFIKNLERMYTKTWVPLGVDTSEESQGITTKPKVRAEYTKIFKKLQQSDTCPKLDMLWNNYLDGTTGPFGTSPQESWHKKFPEIPSLKKVGDSETAITIINDVLCRGNFSILNKCSNFTVSGNDKKALHICMQRAWEFWQMNHNNEMCDHAYNEILNSCMYFL